jgi:hypothetical protein
VTGSTGFTSNPNNVTTMIASDYKTALRHALDNCAKYPHLYNHLAAYRGKNGIMYASITDRDPMTCDMAREWLDTDIDEDADIIIQHVVPSKLPDGAWIGNGGRPGMTMITDKATAQRLAGMLRSFEITCYVSFDGVRVGIPL